MEKLGVALELLSKGYSQRQACTEAQLSRSTFHELMKDDEVGPVIQAAIDQGLGQLEHRVFESAAMGDWRAAARLLEQRAPAEWSTKAQIELAGKVNVNAEVRKIEPDPAIQAAMSDPVWAKAFHAQLDMIPDLDEAGFAYWYSAPGRPYGPPEGTKVRQIGHRWYLDTPRLPYSLPAAPAEPKGPTR